MTTPAHTPETAIHPFIVPKFHPGGERPKPPQFFLWGWNPNYPYWSRSCWHYDSKEEAESNISHLKYYHVKVILHDENGTHEVSDFPCEELSAWARIASHKTSDEIAEVNAKSEQTNATVNACAAIPDPESALRLAVEALEAAVAVYQPSPFFNEEDEDLPPPFQCNCRALAVDECADDCVRKLVETALAQLAALTPKEPKEN